MIPFPIPLFAVIGSFICSNRRLPIFMLGQPQREEVTTTLVLCGKFLSCGPIPTSRTLIGCIRDPTLSFDGESRGNSALMYWCFSSPGGWSLGIGPNYSFNSKNRAPSMGLS